VSIAQVAAQIPAGAALVEILRYTPKSALYVLPAPKGGAREPVPAGDEPARYAAYTLRHDGALTWADLGEAAPIDAAVTALRAVLISPAKDAKPAARALYQRTMGKILPALGEVSTLLISPDGALGLVPFGALVDDRGRYLIERCTLTYLTSGRDRLRPAAPPAPRQVPLLLGNPAFSATIGGSAPKGGERSMDLRGVRFPPLPGTATEVSAIATLLPRAQLLTGAAATETAVKALRGPGLVHLATHGFYAPDTRKDKVADAREDPMLRTGIALAGADHGGRGGDDGILTALEASSLDLRGTRLVVLSACETGLGDASEGDGIYGLRRALVIAGAETVVTSLWRVADAATRDLMQAYYAELRRGAGRSEAMRKVELGMLAEPGRAHPYFWASFIVSGNDGPLGEVFDGPAGASNARVTPGPRGCGCALIDTRAASPSGWLALGLLSLLALRRRPRR
jgi:MYXO-CTERM domain-containing protein